MAGPGQAVQSLPRCIRKNGVERGEVRARSAIGAFTMSPRALVLLSSDEDEDEDTLAGCSVHVSIIGDSS